MMAMRTGANVDAAARRVRRASASSPNGAAAARDAVSGRVHKRAATAMEGLA